MSEHGPVELEIDAPYATVRDVIKDTFEIPGRYSGERLLCRMRDRNENSLTREIYWPAGDGRSEIQTLSWSDGEAEFVVHQRIDGLPAGTLTISRAHSDHEGRSRIALDPGGHGNSIAGEPKVRTTDEIGTRILSTLKSKASAPDWVANFFAVLDRMEASAFGALFRPDSDFRFGATLRLVGSDAVRDHSPEMWSNLAGLSHHLSQTVLNGEEAGVECVTSYLRKNDGCWVSLPAAVFMTAAGGRIEAIRIYADSSLLGITWP